MPSGVAIQFLCRTGEPALTPSRAAPIGAAQLGRGPSSPCEAPGTWIATRFGACASSAALASPSIFSEMPSAVAQGQLLGEARRRSRGREGSPPRPRSSPPAALRTRGPSRSAGSPSDRARGSAPSGTWRRSRSRSRRRGARTRAASSAASLRGPRLETTTTRSDTQQRFNSASVEGYLGAPAHPGSRVTPARAPRRSLAASCPSASAPGGRRSGGCPDGPIAR